MCTKFPETPVTLVNQQQTGTTGGWPSERARVAMYALRLARLIVSDPLVKEVGGLFYRCKRLTRTWKPL